MLHETGRLRLAAIMAFVLVFRFSSAELTFDLSVERNSRTTLTGQNDVRPYSGFPSSFAMGDFNGDGRTDLAISASQTAYNARRWSGCVYVKFGSLARLTGPQDLADADNFDIRYDCPPFPLAGGIGGIHFADLNGDGVDDLAMGFPGADYAGFRDCGCVYVKFGGPNLTTGIIDLSVETNTDIRFYGGSNNAKLGTTVASADLNADGRVDLILGASASFNARPGSCSVFLLFGRAGGFTAGTVDVSAAFDVRFDGSYSGSGLCNRIASRDVNGDSVADLVMSDGGLGGVAIRYGGASFPVGPSAVVDLADSNNYNLALETWSYSVNSLALADINGDSTCDILIGETDAPGDAPVIGGCLYVVFGGTTLPQGPGATRALWNGEYDIRYDGVADNDSFGVAVAGGDVNGDGIDDWACVAGKADPYGRLEAGSCYVKFGSSSTARGTFSLAEPANWDVRFDAPAEREGLSICFIGDLNTDGAGDLCMGVLWPTTPRKWCGANYVVYGGSSFPEGVGTTIDLAAAGSYDALLYGGNDGPLFGLSVSAGGDFNGDGIGDLIVGSPWSGPWGSNGVHAGNVFLKFGSPSFPTGRLMMDNLSDFDVRIVNTDFEDAGNLGWSVSWGDLNNDGIDDLLMVAPERHSFAYGGIYVWVCGAELPTGPGASVVLRDGGAPPPPSVIFFENRLECQRLGSARVASGDLTGDAIDDFVLCASLMTDESSASYAYFWVKRGATNILAEDPTWSRDLGGARITRLRIPIEVAPTCAIGDVNSDGVGDLVMGTPNSDENGRTNSGSVFVRFGGPTFPPNGSLVDLSVAGSYDTRFDGGASEDGLGSVVASGDVNGDDISDIVMGAGATDNNGRSNSGSIYVIFGGAGLPTGNVDLANASNFNIRYDGPDADGSLGMGACIGDINGDNVGDVLMGAPFTDFNLRQNSGSVYVKFGGPAIPTGIRDLSNSANYDLRYDGANKNDMLGTAISTGNLDGSTPPELVLGCPLAEWDNRSDIGVVYIPQITAGTPSGGDTSDSDPSICFIGTSSRNPSRWGLLHFLAALMALSMVAVVVTPLGK